VNVGDPGRVVIAGGGLEGLAISPDEQQTHSRLP